MKNSRSDLPLRSSWTIKSPVISGLLVLIILFMQGTAFAKISIDINSPSIQRIQVAIPDFKNLNQLKDYPELATELPEIVSNDLDLCGYFLPMDKAAFLDQDGSGLTQESIYFKNWTLIGAELLLKAGYTCIGENNIEVEVRLYDTFLARQLLSKKFIGRLDATRTLMHRISNEIIYSITGSRGLFLSRFVFVNNQTGNKELYICDFDGRNVEQLTSYNNITLLPKWSPTGDRIVFTSYTEDKPMLYLMDMASGDSRIISGKDGLNIAGASWHPDGDKLALTLRRSGNSDIFTINTDGKVLEQLTRHWAIDTSPAFSPDGTRMAFVSNRSGNPQIYIKDMESGNEERITFDLKYCTSPVWSQTGKIAFSVMEDGDINIYSINPDGSGVRKLTDGSGNNEDPYWSPDGRYIVFSSNRDGGGYNLYIMTSNGQNQRRITFIKGDNTAPSWSPF